MLNLYYSNKLDYLREMLVEVVRVAPLTDPLAREQILVQSPGMAQWLKLELARAFGIAANVEFPLPASFIWQMFTQVLEDVPAKSPYNKAAMSWQLMVILPRLLTQEAFAPLRGYLAAEPSGSERAQWRLWQLCQQIADLFDQYLVYRPDWIEQWEQGDGLAAELAGVSGQDWQPILWRELVARTLQLASTGYHRANLYEAFIEVLASRPDVTAVLPKRVFVFGISALPPRYVDALRALGERIDVHLFVCNPCRHYWGDLLDQKTLAKLDQRLKPGTSLTSYQGPANPLLASMGKQGRDYLYQLLDLDANEISAYAERVDVDQPGLLHRLQQHVLDLVDPSQVPSHPDSSEHKQAIDPEDTSLQIHACHGPVRELEVLHDQLLDLFRQDPSLTPKDVVVMMPDINRYAPAIQAVFGARSQIPYSISDRSAAQENPLLLSLLALLRLPQARLGASEVLAILEEPAVLARFELNSDAFTRIGQWVQAAGVRWGLDEQFATRFDLPALSGNSWLFGLRRLLLGYAMGDGEAVQGILPYAEVEGQEAQWLGQLAEFIDRLAHWLPVLQTPAPLGEWRQRILDLLDAFYRPSEDDERVLQMVRDLLTGWQQQVQEAGLTDDLTPVLMHALMQDALSRDTGSPRFLAGQVNFCTLMPMRSIPFRQICLLGMNDGLYPRTLLPMGFDLISKASRRGDRSRREDDRYLFLEALLSAEDGLYISYQGFSEQDNTERVPSVLLAELLDYCCQAWRLPADAHCADDVSAEHLRQHLVRQHPLTPYSREYFYPSAQSGLFTYAKEWLPALQPKPNRGAFIHDKLALPDDWQDALELAELLRFWREPCSYFLNRRLKVRFTREEWQLCDHEPFELDALARYQLKDELVSEWLAGHAIEDSRQRRLLSGQLPQGGFGDLQLAALERTAAQLAAQLRPWWHEPTTQEVMLPTEAGLLRGWLTLRGDALLVFKPGTLNGRDWLRGWIQHLCLCLMMPDAPRITRLVDENRAWALRPVPEPEAKACLDALMLGWREGMQRPVAFFPKTAWVWAQEWHKSGDETRAADKAEAAFLGGFNVMGEVEDRHVARCYPELSPEVWDELRLLSQRHISPLFDYLEEIK